jgi:hypothetical protein
MKTLYIPVDSQSFCMDNSCDYYRSNDDVFNKKPSDIESSHNFFSFRISC